MELGIFLNGKFCHMVLKNEVLFSIRYSIKCLNYLRTLVPYIFGFGYSIGFVTVVGDIDFMETLLLLPALYRLALNVKPIEPYRFICLGF